MSRRREPNEQFIQCMKNLGVMVSEYREKNGETKTAFARGCGIKTSTVERIEAGSADPRVAALGRIAEHMGMSVFELMRHIGMSDSGETKSGTDD